MASVITNTALSVLGRFLGLLVGLGITAMLGRLLGVEQFGQYTLILSFGAILHVLTDGGLYLTLTREMSRRSDQQRIVAAVTGLRLFLYVCVFSFGAIIISTLPKYSNLLGLYSIAATGFLFQSLSQLLMGVMQVQKTMWPAATGDVVGRFVQFFIVAAVFLGLITTGDRLVLLAMTAFACGAGAAYLVHSLFVPRIKPWRIKYDRSLWWSLAKSSWPLGAMLLINAIYFRVDILMISWLRPESEVGWYGLAYRVVESGLFLPAAFGGLLLPRLSETVADSKKAKLLQQALYSMMLAGVIAFIVLSGAARQLIVLLVGVDFIPSAKLLSILSAALATMFLGNVFGFTLVSLGRQRDLLRLYVVLAIGNVIGNGLFIPLFGATAAAWTTVVTEAMSTIVAAKLVSRQLSHVLPLQDVGRVIIVGVIAALSLYAMLSVFHVLIAVAISVLVYALGLFVTGLLRREKISLLISP